MSLPICLSIARSLNMTDSGQQDIYRFSQFYGIFFYLAVIGQNMQSGFFTGPQGVAEGPVSFIIGMKFLYVFHLYYKEHKGLVPLRYGAGQSKKVLDAPLGRGVRETDDSIFFQSYALYFHRSNRESP